MNQQLQAPPAYLLLADGTVFSGRSMGVRGRTIGEIVFATGMTAYQETLTDPSYYGQIVTQTFPLVGNYGLNDGDVESGNVALSGYIVREWCEVPSNFRCQYTLVEYLKQHGIVGLCGIDTRRLTRIIREYGVMNGMILEHCPEDAEKETLLRDLRGYRVKAAVANVSSKAPRTGTAAEPKYRVALLDFGYKHNIERELLRRGCEVTVLPHDTAPEEIRALGPDGIMLSNGPGDPKENQGVIENLRAVMAMQLPIFGICLGHQLLALANGADTEKLKYGHRGANQPVTDLATGRTYVTSQNHGYAVICDSVRPQIGEVSHINANDRTCEGIRYRNAPAFTVQFHPEACGGPADTAYLFDEFLSMMREKMQTESFSLRLR